MAHSYSLAGETPSSFTESSEPSMETIDHDLGDASFLQPDAMDDFLQNLGRADFVDLIPSAASPYPPFFSPKNLSLSLDLANGLQMDDLAAFRRAPPKSDLALTRLKHQDLAVDYIADLVVQIIKAFPRQMLRRATFPPFIHPNPHLPSLPEKIATCMSIAQLFDSRTNDTRPFLGRVIDAEEARIRLELEDMNGEGMPKEELQYAGQALMIYIVMVIVDQCSLSSPSYTARGKRLLQTLEEISTRMHRLMGWQYCSTTEEECPSRSWDEWIFAESNRRIGCLWFVICRVFTTQDRPCPAFETWEHIPLSSPKPVWEARTEEEWRHEKAICEAGTPFIKFGELIEAKRGMSGEEGVRGLERWESGCDKMGLLMGFGVALT
jgi:hypothetical protein